MPPVRVDPGRARTLADACVVVTGAAGGIGRALADAFARANARLVLTDIDAGGVSRAVTELRGSGAVVESVATDIADPAAQDRIVEAARAAFGRIDVLVNNAGVVHADPLLDLPFETWRRVLRVNLDGTFLVTQSVARSMAGQVPSPTLERRGMIVFVSSIAADVGRPTLAAYGASKAAVNHLAMTCALTLGPRGISTTAFYPSRVREGMWTTLGGDIAKAEGRTREAVEGDRGFQPASELAQVVVDGVALAGLVLNGCLLQWSRDVEIL